MTSRPGAAASRVDIGGRALYLVCAGTGSPPVILESGYGNGAGVWTADLMHPGSSRRMVHAGAAVVTGVCAYDRANAGDRPGSVGRSDHAAKPRTAADLVGDLRDLLAAAGVPAPRVLVGHSFGALLIRLYAYRYPDEVAGLVLVDGAHEDYENRLRRLVRPRGLAGRQRYNAFDHDPEDVDLVSLCTEVHVARDKDPLLTMPMVVLAHGRAFAASEFRPGWPVEAHEDLWRELQEDLADLAPTARLMIANLSGHYIHQDQPDLVVEAIRQVVAAVRDPNSWSLSTAAPAVERLPPMR
jgi:pimeloyl-ACP methyl ester carboxylesterase